MILSPCEVEHSFLSLDGLRRDEHGSSQALPGIFDSEGGFLHSNHDNIKLVSSVRESLRLYLFGGFPSHNLANNRLHRSWNPIGTAW